TRFLGNPGAGAGPPSGGPRPKVAPARFGKERNGRPPPAALGRGGGWEEGLLGPEPVRVTSVRVVDRVRDEVARALGRRVPPRSIFGSAETRARTMQCLYADAIEELPARRANSGLML